MDMEKNVIPRPEYPRPDFERDDWQNLNGEWEFAFDDADAGEKENWQKREVPFADKILVPFCFQSKLSGIEDHGIHEFMWYRRHFDLEDSLKGRRILLKFGAVDTIAKVWLNGIYLGMHKGSYTSFEFDISEVVRETDNVLVVKAEDSYECSKPRGKQHWGLRPSGCWYTATSGIWQTVWMEAVDEVYLEKIRLTPDIDRRCVEAEFYFPRFYENVKLELNIFYKEKPVKYLLVSADRKNVKLTIDIREEDYVGEIHYWTPEAPNLYDLDIKVHLKGRMTDHVRSYFGMRKISVSGKHILLNNRPYYQRLILDQGYWPDSLLTPPSDEAIRQDILLTKEFGYNGARKHQKIEDPRYYYWADRLGLLVWGEMPSGYAFDAEEIETITEEWVGFINRDYNHPCIVTWVPFNESWGVRNILTDKRQQAFGEALYYITKALDPIRLVSTNDGWEQIHGDICAVHDYAGEGDHFRRNYQDLPELFSKDAQGKMLYAEGYQYSGEPVLLTEYGGIAFCDNEKENWGYNSPVKDEEEFISRFTDLTQSVRSIPGLCGYCYTQLTDVQQEVNGLLTAERKCKIAPEVIREINCKK